LLPFLVPTPEEYLKEELEKDKELEQALSDSTKKDVRIIILDAEIIDFLRTIAEEDDSKKREQ